MTLIIMCLSFHICASRLARSSADGWWPCCPSLSLTPASMSAMRCMMRKHCFFRLSSPSFPDVSRHLNRFSRSRPVHVSSRLMSSLWGSEKSSSHLMTCAKELLMAAVRRYFRSSSSLEADVSRLTACSLSTVFCLSSSSLPKVTRAAFSRSTSKVFRTTSSACFARNFSPPELVDSRIVCRKCMTRPRSDSLLAITDGSRRPTSWLTSSSSSSSNATLRKQSSTACWTLSLGTSSNLKSSPSRPCLLSSREASWHLGSLLEETNFRKRTTETTTS
mmetsp:Transcript_45255/g.119557  ORF Transcript_45255/g.119557 Transcript_45255/m.119557 type:complete len:276 (-) Transcript_45255:2625-3452(-)